MSTKTSNCEWKTELFGITENAILTEIQHCLDGILSAFQEKDASFMQKVNHSYKFMPFWC